MYQVFGLGDASWPRDARGASCRGMYLCVLKFTVRSKHAKESIQDTNVVHSDIYKLLALVETLINCEQLNDTTG